MLKGKYHFAFKYTFKEENRICVIEWTRRGKIDHSAFFQRADTCTQHLSGEPEPFPRTLTKVIP